MNKEFLEFKQNLQVLIEYADNFDLKLFTFELLDCIWVDILEENDAEMSKELIDAYANEVRNSLEIMNPDLKMDIEILENLLKELEFYLEIN